ncbi:putative dehydratase nit22 [Emmonsiellopsis sp. PD_33]|nr:putative dehydratase nit22 [Emmonsiellopsis sp. PD_33]
MPITIPQFSYPPQEVSWLKRDALLFANSIGCRANGELHFLYELHPNFQVFPTYPIVLTFKHTSPSTIDFLSRNASRTLPPGCPKLDWAVAVDGRRRMTFHRPLPPTSQGKTWEIYSRVLGAFDKGPGKGTVMELEHVLRERGSGEVYTRAWESAFFKGTGGWGGERGPKIIRYPPPTSARGPDADATFQTNEQTAHLYRLNGDYNPLHATPEPGQSLGYGGIIMHGLFSWNVAAQAILSRYGGSQGSNLRDFEARFAAPVRPGDKLDIHMWDMGMVEADVGDGNERVTEIRFVVKVGERIVLSDGRALLSGKHQSNGSKL